MHGDCMKIKNKIKKIGYAKKRIATIINLDNGFITEEIYYEIDGQMEVIFDANSPYGLFCFFPN